MWFPKGQSSQRAAKVGTLSVEAAPKDESQEPLLEEAPEDAASVATEEDLSREQFDVMKAQTMYGMVDLLGDGETKLMFITNKQCEQIVKNPASLQKMLDVLEVGKPRLVISLLESRGMQGYTQGLGPDLCAYANSDNWGAGLKYGSAPYASKEEERMAQSRIDMFMSEVLLPLAVQTQAIILANAIRGTCVLSMAFTRAVSVNRAKWGGQLPFTVLSMASNLANLYRNHNLSTYWRQVRRVSRPWRQHDQVLCQKYPPPPQGPGETQFDLDQNALIFILNDRLRERDQKFDAAPFSQLQNRLLATLSSRLPSLALKTGFANRGLGKDPSSLEVAVDVAQSGTPTVFLDVRPRPLIQAADRSQLIEQAKAKYTEWCEGLRQLGTLENLDICSIAYFHDVLFGDGDHRTVEGADVASTESRQAVPLHEAILTASQENLTTSGQSWSPASSEEVMETCRFLAHRFFKDAFESCFSQEEQESKGSCEQFWGEQTDTMIMLMHTLFKSEHLYHCNLGDLTGAQRLVNRLVRLDRVPLVNPLEGLLLLQAAWRDHDVAVMLANSYKNMYKAIFLFQLFLGWLTVISCSLALWINENAGELPCADDSSGNNTAGALTFMCGDASRSWALGLLSRANFGFSILVTLLYSFEGLFNSKSRWHLLRSSAGRLESLIWQYRARVGKFDVGFSSGTESAETVLANDLNLWRDTLTASATLKATSFAQSYDSSTFTHFQHDGLPETGAADDHQSPVQAARYIDLRILPTIQFYQSRIPAYTRAGYVQKVFVLLLGVASSLLASFEISPGVSSVTALATALTSWIEFSDAFRKVERYSSVVISLEKLRTWWNSLTGVEKVSRDNIARLVHSTEGIISQEQLAWYTTAPKNTDKEDSKKGKEERKED